MRIVVLDPESSEPTWGPLVEAVVLEVPDNATDDDVIARLGEVPLFEWVPIEMSVDTEEVL